MHAIDSPLIVRLMALTYLTCKMFDFYLPDAPKVHTHMKWALFI